MRKCLPCLLVLIVLLPGVVIRAAEIEIDFSKTIGTIRALHGGNDGPIQFGGLVDLSQFHREIGVPYTRLHDCRWPNGDVIDMHVVFPNAMADASLPSSYDFARTDECIDSVLKTGAKVIYRLGESIEHTPRKYHVNPPADVDHWAAQCVGIIRHYNEGWAGGAHDDIRYWEIWNEPENRPSCFTGTDEDYFRMYAAAARAIKDRWPELKVGGPALGYTGKIVDGHFEPGEFLVKFLAYCRDHSLPLDFFSWHLYGNDPAEYPLRAKAIRRILDQYGFGKAEMHLNEWNYLPDNQWLSFDKQTQGEIRERYFQRMTGAESAAFISAVLIELQDSPVDVANFFAMNTQALGLFSEQGSPRKNFYAFKGFRSLLDTPERIAVHGGSRQLFACAGVDADRSRAGILISNLDPSDHDVSVKLQNLPWKGDMDGVVYRVDAERSFQADAAQITIGNGYSFQISLTAPATCLILLRQRHAGR